MRRVLREYWTRFDAAFHYAEPGPTRFWLITCVLSWGLWLLIVPGELADVDAWRLLAAVGGERVVGPTATVVALLALAFDIAKSKRATVVADILLTAWWLFVAITLFVSRPESPSIAVYVTLIGFGVWLIYRDVDQI